jgi:hypothetical protein
MLARKLESEQRIQVGDKLGPLRGIDLEGRPVELNFADSNLKTIVLFASVNVSRAGQSTYLSGFFGGSSSSPMSSMIFTSAPNFW